MNHPVRPRRTTPLPGADGTDDESPAGDDAADDWCGPRRPSRRTWQRMAVAGAALAAAGAVLPPAARGHYGWCRSIWRPGPKT